jgi:hypothetical protein
MDVLLVDSYVRVVRLMVYVSGAIDFGLKIRIFLHTQRVKVRAFALAYNCGRCCST